MIGGPPIAAGSYITATEAANTSRSSTPSGWWRRGPVDGVVGIGGGIVVVIRASPPERRSGALAACNEQGLAVFDRLRYRRADGSVFLYAFDLLELDGGLFWLHF